ncbi:MAG: phosphoglycerate dehydrogenase [Hyphomicrobiales bacterium]|nr:phosphoglycerate dehydrogenase [Hyphomicrobiales bacterium]
MAPRVLIADKLSPLAQRIFEERGLETDLRIGLDKEALAEIIGAYDGLAVRSATKVTEKALRNPGRLKVIGRAGIGVDNIDVPAATQAGVIVMNTPFGNSITTAEHAISLMMALARQIPEADRSTQAGKWEKARFMGVEVTGKTLGIIGCGNIGSIVADRAQGLKMKVIAYDPFLSPERAMDIGVEKVELDELLRRADFISLHTPMTDKTRHIINMKTLAQTKKGVRIINCARGGLVVERDLAEAIKAGQVAGAAFDVFEVEPAETSPLFGLPGVICTPHLGASTTEAQENVAVQVAEQMCDYLLTGAITNAVNFPSISAEEAPRLKPFVKLAELIGSFAGQIIESGVTMIRLEYAGDVAEMNTKALTSAAIAGVLRPQLQDINMVSAPVIARERGVMVEEVRRGQEGAYETYMRVTVRTANRERRIAGTVFSDAKPRVIQIQTINMEAEFAPHMLYTENADKPGHIGALGMLFADSGVNIATFNLGREERGGKAVALVTVDDPIADEIVDKVKALPHVARVSRLRF